MSKLAHIHYNTVCKLSGSLGGEECVKKIEFGLVYAEKVSCNVVRKEKDTSQTPDVLFKRVC